MRHALAVALFVVAALAAPAVSGTYGPPFGANSFTTSIDTVSSVEDTDDYVAPLCAGETLTVTVASAKTSALLAALTLVDPDGTATTPPVIEKKAGKSVLLKAFPITKTGPWTVRVSGKTGTQGGYSIKFKVGAAKDLKLAAQHLGGADPLARDVSFPALDGALLTVTVKWPKTQSAVHIGNVKDPSGGENTTGTPPVEKPGIAKLTNRTLHQGAGTYVVPLSIAAGECTYSVTVHVVAPARPKGKKPVILTPAEPFLEVRATPVRGDTGLTAHLTGSGFPAAPVPQVLFGGVPGTGVVVATDGRSLDVVVPAGTPNSTVEVAVVQADGQASVRAGGFVFVPLPTITDLVNAASASVSGGSTAGGAPRTLVGTGFVAGDVVRFGTTQATGVVVADAAHVQLVMPAHAAGLVAVTLDDEFGRTATAPFQYEFKDPPAFAAAPYSQVYANTGGGTSITITGTGFEATDQLKFNGANLASTFVNATTRTFSSPAIAAGLYTVALVDRFGLTTNGPSFTIKDAPVFAASPYSPQIGPTAGGVSVAIGGTGFEATDQLVFNGSNLASLFVSATSIRFSSPALPAGSYTVALIDRFGQSATGPNFTIKDPPTFSLTPYSPTFANTAGGTTITITGSNFVSTDQLAFNGANISSVFVNSTTRRFTSPAIAAGSYTVVLIDAFGQLSAGPNFTVKNPPAFAVTPYSPAVSNTAGGATITITGSGFESADQLKFNGSNITSAFVSSTSRTFVAPAIAAGTYAVALVDQFGQTSNGPAFPVKDPPTFAATPYSPAFSGTAGGVTITITGTGFESQDQLKFNGTNITSTFVNSTTRRFTSPAIAAGAYAVAIVDRLGQTATGPTFPVKNPPTFASSPYSPSIASIHGGQTVTITGGGFESTDQVKFDGSNVTSTFVSATSRRFTAPASSAGSHSVSLVDRFGQTANGPALTSAGYDDMTTSRQPGTSSADNFLAARGAIGDLDNDGSADDLVITTSAYLVYNYPYGYSSPIGTQTVYTRILFGQGGTFADVTAKLFPAVSTYGDDYKAKSVAIGDLDGDSDQDIAIAGNELYVYKYKSGQYYYLDVRLFSNDGSGSFTQSAYSPRRRTSDVTCSGPFGGTYPVFHPRNTVQRNPVATALAIGDLDGDGDAEIVMSSDFYRWGRVYINPSYVSFSPGFYYDPLAYSHYTGGSTTYYSSGTRIFDNRGSYGFEDVSFPRIPLSGTIPSAIPDFVGRDVKLGDIDGDPAKSLDMVVTWDNPYTTTPTGQYYNNDIARVSTLVLINDGYGFFSDQTSTWMPSVSYPEFWQGNRCELADLDADGKKDLVILHSIPLDGVTTTTSSLRVLQNTGSAFSDVTSSALPGVPLSGTLDDNLRGNALAVRDVNGDGNLDIVVGTTEVLVDSSGNPVRCTRLLLGDGALHFAIASAFLPPTSVDTGEADCVLIGDIAGNPAPSLILLTEVVPGTSTNGERLRVFDWK